MLVTFDPNVSNIPSPLSEAFLERVMFSYERMVKNEDNLRCLKGTTLRGSAHVRPPLYLCSRKLKPGRWAEHQSDVMSFQHMS